MYGGSMWERGQQKSRDELRGFGGISQRKHPHRRRLEPERRRRIEMISVLFMRPYMPMKRRFVNEREGVASFIQRWLG